jgi:hypothetical protein
MNQENQKPNFYELYLMVGEIKGRVEAIDNKLDSLNNGITGCEKRISDLEIQTSNIRTTAATIGGVFGFFVSCLGYLINFFSGK